MPPQTSAARPARRSLESASVWALIATLVLSIIFFLPAASVPFIGTKAFIAVGGALVTLALFILARLSRGNVILPPALLVGALWLPVVAYVLSSLFSGAGLSRALWGSALEPDSVALMLAVAFLGTLTALIFRRTEQYTTFFKAAAYTLGFVIVVQVLTLFIGQFSPSTVAPSFSLLGSAADLAAFLGLGVISILLTLRFLEVSDRSRTLLTVAGALALALLAVFGTTFVWVLVALSSLGLFVEAVMRRSPNSGAEDLEGVDLVSEGVGENEGGASPLILPLVVLAVSLFFLIGGTLGNALASALNAGTLDIRPSWQSTFTVARDVYGSSPIFGSGPGTFGADWLKTRSAAINTTVFWTTDFTSGIGFIPTSLATTGIVGLIAWLGLIGLFLVLGLRMLIFKAPKDSRTYFTALLSFVGMLYLMAYAIFGLPSSALVALLFAFGGLFASTMRFAEGKSQWGVIFSRAPRIGFVIVFVLTLVLLASVVAAYSLVERYVAVLDLSKANTELAAGNLDAASAAASRSIAFSPTGSAYRVQAFVANARMNQIAASTTISTTEAQKSFQAALSDGINAALTATRIQPNNYQNWIALGGLYAQAVPLNVSGAYDSALSAYQKAQDLNPTNPQIAYALAQLDIAHKDTKSAEENLKKAIALKQDYTAAILLLSQIYVNEGNVKDALASAEAAAYFTPNNPDVLFQLGILRAASKNLPGAATALSAAVDANPNFANARYFLAAVLAKQGNTAGALEQVQAIADISDANAKAVAGALATLKEGKDPFPANLLTISTPAAQ